LGNILIAFVLALWAYIGIVLLLGPGVWFNEPLVSGLFTGLIVGDVHTGLVVGATMTLLGLGQWTYGGATIPDYQVGSIIGTAVGASLGGANNAAAIPAGIAIATTAALLMTQLDVLGRATTTIFIHAADGYAEKGNDRGVALMHLLGQLPWGLTRFIPVFLAVWLGKDAINAAVAAAPTWLTASLKTTGHMLPALGFALLLSMLPVRKYWPYLIVGFVLFAFLKLPLIAILLAAAAIGGLVYLQQRSAQVNV